VPHNALARGLWLGDVPEELSSLRYIEKLLIQKVCVSGCFIWVASSGMRKMVAHAIAFESPVARVYHSLPPPVEDLMKSLPFCLQAHVKQPVANINALLCWCTGKLLPVHLSG
jgi:hypothetical protein